MQPCDDAALQRSSAIGMQTALSNSSGPRSVWLVIPLRTSRSFVSYINAVSELRCSGHQLTSLATATYAKVLDLNNSA